jgi:hypothetical protein
MLQNSDSLLRNRSGNLSNINNGATLISNGSAAAGETAFPAATATPCPVQGHGDQYIESMTYTYSASYTSGFNGIEVSGGDNDGVCETGETCRQRFLKSALEIFGDGIGDEDSLCESNESCQFAPNIGAYQGHGSSLVGCTFNANSGLVTGVSMFGFTSNGQ